MRLMGRTRAPNGTRGSRVRHTATDRWAGGDGRGRAAGTGRGRVAASPAGSPAQGARRRQAPSPRAVGRPGGSGRGRGRSARRGALRCQPACRRCHPGPCRRPARPVPRPWGVQSRRHCAPPRRQNGRAGAPPAEGQEPWRVLDQVQRLVVDRAAVDLGRVLDHRLGDARNPQRHRPRGGAAGASADTRHGVSVTPPPYTAGSSWAAT